MSDEWQFLVALNGRLRPLQTPREIQETAVHLLTEHLHASRVIWSHADGNEFHGGAVIADACRRGETVTVNDVRTDPRLTDGDRDRLLAQHIAAVVAAPLVKDGRSVGTLAVHSATPRSWTPDQIALVEITADRTWSAAKRCDAENTLGLTEDRQAFLRRMRETIAPLATPLTILSETCRLLGEHLRVNRVAYGEIDGDDCVIVDDYVNGLPSSVGRFRWTGLGGSRSADILKGGTLSVNDTSTEIHTLEERTALQAAGIGAYICPLLIKDGLFVASFGVHSRAPRAWTRDEITLAEEVADRIWATLAHRKAEAELLANEERLGFLLRFNDALRPLIDAGEVQQTAARLLGEYLGVSRVGYADIGDGGYMIRYEHTRGEVAPLAGEAAGVTLSPELREALRRGETISISDVDTDPRLGGEDRASFKARQMAAFIAASRFRDGRMVAAFGANNVTSREWTAQEIDLVRDVAERTWDAVDRSRAEAASVEHERRLQMALDASGGGSWTWVAATNQADWDDRFRALYGFTPDEPATSDKWPARVHEEDRPRVTALLGEIMGSPAKDSWQHTFRIVRPDGSIGWIQSRGRVDRDPAGRITRLTGLDLDFSQHRLLEEASRAKRDEEHDRTLRTLIETSNEGIVSIDEGGVIVSANRAMHDMFGWAQGELIGESIDRLLPAPLREMDARNRAAFFAAPHPQVTGGGLLGERKDRSTFPIELSSNHVTTPDGGRGFAFVTDITDRERAASALQAHADELEYRTMQLSRMASDLTLAEQRARQQIASTLHDGLQQSLVIATLGLDQYLKREDGAGAVPPDLLQEVRRQLEEAIEASRSLTLELFPPVLQHAGFPAALVWLANWIHDKYKIRVHVDADPRADTPRRDVRTLLFESVRELVFNAVKHAQADRVTVELTLTEDEQLCITVADAGLGFNPKTLDDRSKVAVGWGLFSIRERLTLLGGRVDIDSAPGQGTQVRLIAPRGAAPGTPTDQHIVSDAPAGPAAAGADVHASPNALRILLVDDHAAVRNGLRDILHARPQFSVIGDAANGFEAIACARTLRPDVILMDVAMPHLDGLQATARIHAELPDIQILGLSMQAGSAVAHALEDAGAAAFFVKGIDTQRLVNYLLTLHATRVRQRETPT